MKAKKENKKNFKKISLSIIVVIMLFIISFIIYEVATVHNTYSIGEKNLQIPIFVYHNIVATEDEVEFDYMQTTSSKFEEQMSGLLKIGYQPIDYETLKKYKEGEVKIPKWSFLVTFDDGYTGVYEYALPIAEKYQIPMTVFEIDDTVGIDGYCTWEQLKELKESGWFSVYSHGYTHIEYDKETPERLVELTNLSYQNITTQLNDPNVLKVFTYPYGLCTEEHIEALAKEGFIQNLTDNRVNQSNKLDLSRLHRCYPLDNSVLKILLKIQYRSLKYGG